MVDVLTGNMYYYGNDKLGTPQIMTDSTNTVVWEGEYKPFGKADVNPNSTVVNQFRFPGQYYDTETGLHYNYHRYYDPKTGRYLTADPIGIDGGINLFVYVLNDPVNSVDLLGLESCTPFNDCFRKCINDNYGASFDVAFGLSPFSIPALAQDVYNSLTETIANEILKSLPLEGAFTKGDIIKKAAASSKAASRAKRLSSLTKGLGALSKASGLIGAGAGGYVAGASMYCAAKCTAQ
jgi:RHS repeat-associated protein